jgi:YegS/Rv2252/BmrU family lipid kinase
MSRELIMNISVILNANSGSLLDKDVPDIANKICAAFQKAGHNCQSYICQGNTLAPTLEDAVKNAEALVVGGGDGTLRAAANAALKRDIALGVLPLGTMNLLAKDLSIPLELQNAVEVLSRGHVRKIDVGVVNDQIFLNKVTIGVFVDLTKKREQVRGDSGPLRWPSLLAEVGVDVFTSEPMLLTFDTDKKKLKLQTCAVIISNNDFEDTVRLGFKRASIDKGVLVLFITKCQPGWEFLNSMARLLLGKSKDDPNLIKISLERVEIGSPDGKISASIDGEVHEMASPLHFSIKPGALKVIAP